MQCLDRVHRVVEPAAVESREFAFLEGKAHPARLLFAQLRRIGLLGQCLVGGEGLLTPDRGTPDTLVDRVLRFLEVEVDPVFAQIGDLLLAAEPLLADEGYDPDLGGYDVEHHVEADLVIARPRAAVAEIVGSQLLA